MSKQRILSRTFYTGGVANGSDIVPEWFDQGGGAAPISHFGAEPWESFPIIIIGAEVIYFEAPGHLSYTLIGNGYSPDIMLMMGRGELTGRAFYPDGGFPFPARAQANGRNHIDMHIGAGGGERFQAFITLYYVPDV